MNYFKTLFYSLFLLLASVSYASMICPGDKYLTCDADIHDLTLTGKPQLFGSHKYYTPSYEDESFTNGCNVGHIIRKWYLDLNYNEVADYTEPTCYQDIYLSENNYGSIYITYPKDITVSCLEDIPFEGPSIIGRPCDLLGYTYEDKVYNLIGSGENGCKKILRKFTVINWCDYNPNGTNNNGSVWYGTQVIKVIDSEKPTFLNCEDVTIGYNNGCKASVTLKSKAMDYGSCSSAKLFWTAEVDIYGDGTIDYVFSHSILGEFNIPLKNNGDEVQIKLPGYYGRATHKIIWKVKDSCGNLTSCSSTFTTKDNKPPTPYCIQNVSLTIDGQDPWPTKVPASMFNLGAFDNCTSSNYIRHSFSSDPADSIRMFTCQNAGFHTLQIYSHDLEGNYSWCDLYLVVYDNGSCMSTLTAAGKIASPKGKALATGKIEMQSNNTAYGEKVYYRNIVDGQYVFDDVELNKDLKITAYRKGLDEGQIDMVDYVLFKRYLMSIDTLSPFGLLAGDINDDKRANGKDMDMLKDLILNDKTSYGNNDWKFVPSYIKERDVTLKNYSPVFESRKFSGNLDFVCIGKGDFSETLANEVGNRSLEESEFYFGEPLTLDGESYLPLLSLKEIHTNGIKISINRSSEVIRKADVDIDMALVSVDKTNLLITDDVVIKNNMPILYIKATEAFDINISGHLVMEESLNKADIRLIKYNKDSFVYPNPTSDYITIIAAKDDNIKITDLNGRIHYQSLISEYKQKIDVSNFLSGVYFVTINNGTQVIKLIKM